MKNLTTYLFVMFMAMFWVFRIIAAFCFSLGINFIAPPTDLAFEIIILFVTFAAMLLVIKRSMLGALIYLAGNGLYFGTALFNLISRNGGSIPTTELANLFFYAIGVMSNLIDNMMKEQIETNINFR